MHKFCSNSGMNRWQEIEKELQDIRDGKVVDGDPAAREQELLAELDRLEWEAGNETFQEDNGDNPE
ncbi:hypothetical protein Pan258_02240 [Symmachiella dynata]|nr:hypothetical protein Pan258_02240 [Symmachiella dynata]